MFEELNQEVILSAAAGGAKISDENLLLKLFSSNSNGLLSQGTPNQQLDSLLSDLYERQESAAARGVKRKQPADSTELPQDGDQEPSTSSQSRRPLTPLNSQSKLSKRNVLLAQLLSQKTATETVVNTQHTINPMSTPQSKLPKNLQEKLMETSTGASSGATGELPAQGELRPKEQPTKQPTAWDNPRTNPDTPFPGNTNGETKAKPSPGPMGSSGGPQSSGANAQPTSTSANDSTSVSSTSNGTNGSPSQSNVRGAVSDPYLSQIIQQATELQQDVSSGGPPSLSLDQSMTDDATLLNQLDQVLNTSDISLAEIDQLLGIQGGSSQYRSDMSEQMAIDAIQQQLMSDPLPTSAAPPRPPPAVAASLVAAASLASAISSVPPTQTTPLSSMTAMARPGVPAQISPSQRSLQGGTPQLSPQQAMGHSPNQLPPGSQPQPTMPSAAGPRPQPTMPPGGGPPQQAAMRPGGQQFNQGLLAPFQQQNQGPGPAPGPRFSQPQQGKMPAPCNVSI